MTARGPCTDSLSDEDVLGDPNLFLPRRMRRRSATTVCRPRRRAELQAAVIAVAGVDRPISTGLALRDGIPIDGVRVGNTCGHGRRGHGERSDEHSLGDALSEAFHVGSFASLDEIVTFVTRPR